ncbi:RNA polymerase sigma factor [Bacillus sp. Marseille-P3661]|uniref:RNA polymerase sigma factor n=1 Tax=Bacillus sp. Marseille-P3661 TaxID=1936234 RepID=UPI0015E187D7|nr:sigma-70 family RNA polymerase sigma factor [Bacillus sp. Marseille-P3661]
MDKRTKGEELLYGFSNGSSKAFEQFYDQYVSLVFGIAMKILKNKADAEDLCHDVFIEIYNNPYGFNPSRGSIEAWIAIKTKSRCLDRLRKQRHSVCNVEEELEEIKLDGSIVEEQVLMNVERDAIHKAIDSLPSKQKAAIVGNYFKGYTHQELSNKLNRPLGTIKSLVRYGIHNLKKYFDVENSFSKARGEKNDM